MPVENFFTFPFLLRLLRVLPVENPVQNLLKTRPYLLKTPVENFWTEFSTGVFNN